MKNKVLKRILFLVVLWFIVYILTGLFTAHKGLPALIDQNDYAEKADGGVGYMKE